MKFNDFQVRKIRCESPSMNSNNVCSAVVAVKKNHGKNDNIYPLMNEHTWIPQ